MAKYQALVDFIDLKDKRKRYNEGDPYPRPANKKIDADRIDELKTKKSRKGVPFIKELEPEVIEDTEGGEE